MQTLVLTLSLLGLASHDAPVGKTNGFKGIVRDVARLEQNLKWLETLQQGATGQLTLTLKASDAGLARFTGTLSAGGKTYEARGQVVEYIDVKARQLVVTWKAPGGEMGFRTYFRQDARGRFEPIDFGPAFKNPTTRKTIDLSCDYTVDGGYEKRDYPFSLANASLAVGP